jgi:alanine-glyoxylate transaminase/serine-glyoxylate transaminase/serine-pyruvate transaminase
MAESKPHIKLMIPGPIEVEDAVLDAMGEPIHAHYGATWVPVHNEVIDLLKQVFRTSGKMFMLPGSGSLAIDTAFQSVFAPGDKVVIGSNGTFGIRLVEVASANGIQPIVINAEANQPLDPAAFARALDADPSIVGVAVVHLETSTAILNPVREIAAVAHERGRLFMADGVSSVGNTPFEMDAWNIDVTVSASQKGLGGAPGLAIVAVGDRAWERVAGQPERPRSWYLDLRRWQFYAVDMADYHPFPVTMPTSVILGLREGLRSLLADGLDARFAAYATRAKRLREGLRAMGLPPSIPDALMSSVLTVAAVPEGTSASEIVAYLTREHNIRITTGFGGDREKLIRIGHMGSALTDADIDALLVALREFLAERVSS